MTTNPFLNALAAAVYITLVAFVMYYGQRLVGPVDSVIAPIAFLSLFVLSAAIMWYVFFYQPAQLYLDGDKKTARSLFVKTLSIFACITILALFTLFFTGGGFGA